MAAAQGYYYPYYPYYPWAAAITEYRMRIASVAI